MTAARRDFPPPVNEEAPAIAFARDGHVLATWRNVVVQVYAAEARADTVTRATTLMERATRQHPRGLGSIVLVSHQGRPPDAESRAAWVQQMKVRRMGALLLLFEGTSLRASIVRGVATSLTLVAGRSVNMHVAGTPREGVPWFVRELDRLGAPCGTEAEIYALIVELRALAA